MKRLKKLVSLLSAVAICALLPGMNVLTVSAAEPVTYYVKYLEEDKDWRFKIGSWENESVDRELYYMYNDFKDGDIVVVDSNNTSNLDPLVFSKHISNLTVVNGSVAAVSAPSIGLVHAIQDSRVAITGDVNEAYIYDNAGITFYNNVNKLTLIDSLGEANGVANSLGTAGHVLRQTASGYIYYEVFNVAAGKLLIDGGELKTAAADYSTTPSAPQAPAPQAPTVQAPVANTQPPTASNEYDDVPKTGEGNAAIWLIGIAAICLVGKRALKNS